MILEFNFVADADTAVLCSFEGTAQQINIILDILFVS